MIRDEEINLFERWRADWPSFAREVLGVYLDKEQEEILYSVQKNARTSVASGTARGKDFICAVACVCFLYLMPEWNEDGTELIGTTKVAMTAPTDRQVGNIMFPEISRLYQRAENIGASLPGGRLTGYDIRTKYHQWFLTGFKADHHNTEAWTGFHAVNTMFAVTEASGMPELVFDAIEGNLQNNSRLLIVFNPNTSVGYAANSQKDPRWSRFQLSSLTAPNVIEKKIVIPGQVDYEWIQDKVKVWATPIRKEDVLIEEDDFEFEGQWYRPEDIFRVKVLGKFPKVPEYILIPPQWYDAAVKRWNDYHINGINNVTYPSTVAVGLDVAGMGRDSSVATYRADNIVSKIVTHNSAGRADHMKLVGQAVHDLESYPKLVYKIDTIGEGAGVYSRLEERNWNQGTKRVYSAKYSEAAVSPNGSILTDVTGQYKFFNMRAYCYWALRDALDPKNNFNLMLPENPALRSTISEIRWAFNSNGKIQIEPKLDIIDRLKKSPDELDSLTLTFYPEELYSLNKEIVYSKEELGFY